MAIGEVCIAGAGSLAGGSSADGCVALGYHASSTGSTGVAMGAYATVDHQAGVAIGYLTSSTANYAVALGREASAENDNSFAAGLKARTTGVSSTAIGPGALATREGEHARSGFTPDDPVVAGVSFNAGESDLIRNFLRETSINGAVETLHTPGNIELLVADEKSYRARIVVLGSRTDALGSGDIEFAVRMHATGGVLTIDRQTIVETDLPSGWAVTVSDPGGLTLRIEVNGDSGQTVKFTSIIEWISAEGF